MNILAKELVAHTQKMAGISYGSALSQEFAQDYRVFFEIFSKWQSQELTKGEPITCKSGCAHCCNHWVEDVYSFEITQIAAIIHHELPRPFIEHLIKVCKDDEELLLDIVEESGSEDEIELLNLFFQKERPCPFVMEDKSCAIYEYRPLTCRGFFSRKPVEFCLASHSFDEESATFMTEIPEPVEDLLDEIDAGFITENGPTGLRSQLWRLLSENLESSDSQ